MGRMLTTGRQVPALPGSTLRPKPRRTAHASVIRPVARAALEALGRAAAAGSDKSPLECVGVCDAAPTRECSPLPIFAAVFFTSFVLDFRPASADLCGQNLGSRIRIFRFSKGNLVPLSSVLLLLILSCTCTVGFVTFFGTRSGK